MRRFIHSMERCKLLSLCGGTFNRVFNMLLTFIRASIIINKNAIALDAIALIIKLKY